MCIVSENFMDPVAQRLKRKISTMLSYTITMTSNAHHIDSLAKGIKIKGFEFIKISI